MFSNPVASQLGDSDPLSRPKLERSLLAYVAFVAFFIIDIGLAGAVGITWYRTYRFRQSTRQIQSIQVRQHIPTLERSK